MIRDWLSHYRRKLAPLSTAAADTEQDPALRHVYLALFDVQRSHALIDVAIDGSDARFQSIILDVDPGRGTVTIDELFPRDFYGLPGQPLLVTVRVDSGRKLSFNTHIVARREEGDDLTYQLMLPQALDYNQRRAALRLHLTDELAVNSEFVTPNRSRCLARVRDLSATGIRLQLPNGVEMAEGDALNELCFEFAGRNFQCNASVRNVRAGAEGVTELGAAFVDLSKSDQRSLSRVIMQLQRERSRDVQSALG